MNKVEVVLINESKLRPACIMQSMAKLTQRGHKILNADDLCALIDDHSGPDPYALLKLPHGSIKRHTPITLGIVGASRRFLMQARTHHVGIDFVSASMQYSDYSNDADFYVPYEFFKYPEYLPMYLNQCNGSFNTYRYLARIVGHDAAAYAMPHALRNVLICTANHEAWLNFIQLRTCNRNTDEMQYVATLIWDTLFKKSIDGSVMFSNAGPDCLFGTCRERQMSCKKPLPDSVRKVFNPASALLKERWPKLYEDNN